MNAITVTNLSKLYKISPEKRNSIQQKSLKDDLMRLIEKPYKLFSFRILKMFSVFKIKLKVKQKKIDYWALKKINFSLEEGEILGVIGVNGSGKSTLLKILAGITPPTHGEIRLHGNVSSLLAVGLGFHSDLSGRENIFFNGALLGFKKKDIEKELNEIIKFAEIGKFIDTPVKYYSSGMYVRLAFSIATSRCMKPNIFLIDEVLSVGDIGFQNKSLKRIKRLTKQSKTTVVIVSHNMDIIKNLSNKCLLLHQGKILSYGEPNKIISEYQEMLNYRK